MLPIESWRIYYADGSTFTSEDGQWAEAPAFGVQAVVYYHVPDGNGLRRKTVDGGRGEGDVYVWEGDDGLSGVKMGLWMDSEGYYRVHELATASVSPDA